MEVTVTNKGYPKIIINGYAYIKDRNNVTSIAWKCSRKGCKGRLSTKYNYQETLEAVELGQHHHPPDPAGVAATIAVGRMKDTAVLSQEPPRRVVSDTVIGLRDEVLVKMPNRENLRRTIQRKRQHHEAFPPIPQGLDFAVHPEFRSVTINNQERRFLLADTLEDPELEGRIILFATDEMLDLLVECPNWMADGTFKVSTEHFIQMYTVHAILGGDVFPCIYAFLSSKNQQTYEKCGK